DLDTVKIADFGVARFSHAESPITRVGTNIFAPPEHSPMLSENMSTMTFTELTPASDIYSLAKTAYVLITGESPRFLANQPITELPFAFRQEDCAGELLSVLNKATQFNPKERYQNVNDFWQDLAKLYKYTELREVITQVNPRKSEPQPHIARGYSPIAPQKPKFNTSRDIKLQNVPQLKNPALVINLEKNAVDNFNFGKMTPSPQPLPVVNDYRNQQAVQTKLEIETGNEPVRKKRGITKKFITLLVLLMVFAGGLFLTNNYLRGKGLFPQISNPFATQEAVALRDINLRADPSTKNQPVGLVSKDSRLQILSTNDNWYEVKVIEYGRPKDNDSWIDRAWISTKTRSGDDTVKISR
ncbi:MAG TPA: SH3 domain-containing protein, partial [Pyrinomonadaceae bacterium]|nr:SH3 domain-containing protein [Pyrinomonadaceae bacterium]